VGAMFSLIAAGFVVLFLGLLQGSVGPVHTALKFIGILLIAIGVLGSAAISAHRRQRERKQRQREHAHR
jgi:uncharacterized membrane protein YidH (DUF202 family)